MDLQFWIYIIVGVIWFLSRAMRKAPNNTETTDERPRRDSEPDDSGHRPMTFEELLREIQQAKTPQKPIVAQELPESTKLKTAPPIKSYNEVDYDDDIAEEEQDLETIPVNRDTRSNEVYEKAKQDAFYRPSLEETMKLSDTDVKFGHFKEYEEEVYQSKSKDILADFRDPEGFKRAFIMSEILKRKF